MPVLHKRLTFIIEGSWSCEKELKEGEALITIAENDTKKLRQTRLETQKEKNSAYVGAIQKGISDLINF